MNRLAFSGADLGAGLPAVLLGDRIAVELGRVVEREARQRLAEGTVMTIEPFLTTGAIHVKTGTDGWTLSTIDGSLSAQYEHTVIITKGKPILVTAV